MTAEIIAKLEKELTTLDELVSVTGQHSEEELPHDQRQYLLTEDICYCYTQRGFYEKIKSDAMYSEKYILERPEIKKAIDPKETKVFDNFESTVGRIMDYILTEENRQKVRNHITNDPIWSKRINLEPLNSED